MESCKDPRTLRVGVSLLSSSAEFVVRIVSPVSDSLETIHAIQDTARIGGETTLKGRLQCLTQLHPSLFLR